jgi:hypothetical protein
MKNIFLIVTLVLTLGNYAQAACTLEACATTLGGDAGHTAKKCTLPGMNVRHCICTTAAFLTCSAVSVVAKGAACPGGMYLFSSYINGVSDCCVDNACALNDEAPAREEITSDTTNLNKVFDADMDQNRTNNYYGYVDGTLRSPSGGRTSDPMAKLDACLFHTDVTAIDDYVGTADDKHHQCVGASIGCGTTLKNEYCQASGTNDGATVAAAVCKDRCDCIYPGAEGSVCGGN